MLKLQVKPEWQDKALCKGMPPFWFVQSRNDENKGHKKARFVQSLCAICPVQLDCIDYAVTSPNEEFGQWGLPEKQWKELQEIKFKTEPDLIAQIADKLVQLEFPDGI